MSSCFCSVARRRALARISSTEIAGVSSMNIRASESLASALPSRDHSSLERKPLRNFCASTLASEQSMRIASDSADISSENDQILLLKTRGQRVKSAKSCGDPSYYQVTMLDRFGLLQHALSWMLDMLEALANTLVSQ